MILYSIYFCSCDDPDLVMFGLPDLDRVLFFTGSGFYLFQRDIYILCLPIYMYIPFLNSMSSVFLINKYILFFFRNEGRIRIPGEKISGFSFLIFMSTCYDGHMENNNIYSDAWRRFRCRPRSPHRTQSIPNPEQNEKI